MKDKDPNKIQQVCCYRDTSHHLQYLVGVADSVGYVILSADLMKQIADAHSWLNHKYDGYRADEERRTKLEERRKAKMKETA